MKKEGKSDNRVIPTATLQGLSTNSAKFVNAKRTKQLYCGHEYTAKGDRADERKRKRGYYRLAQYSPSMTAALIKWRGDFKNLLSATEGGVVFKGDRKGGARLKRVGLYT